MLAVVVPQPVDMGELGADAAEVVPDAAQDRLDLGGRLLRKCRGEIGAADAMLRQPRADGAQHRAADIRHDVRVEQPDRAQRMHGEKAERRIAERAAAAIRAFVCPEPCQRLEHDHDLAEHLTAFQPRDAALEIGEPDLGVDHRE